MNTHTVRLRLICYVDRNVHDAIMSQSLGLVNAVKLLAVQPM